MAPVFTGNWFNFGRNPATALPPDDGIQATGGTRTTYTHSGTKYAAHAFTASGSLNVSAASNSYPNQCDFLVVGGGGGGAGDNIGSGAPSGRGAGGGGGGGYRTSMPEGPGGPSPTAEGKLTLAAGSYTVTVGEGGDASPGPSGLDGSDGGYSEFSTIRSQGGGGGSYNGPSTGRNGGSGGGGANYDPGTSSTGGEGNRTASTDPTNPAAAPNQGYDGGTGYGTGPGNNNANGAGGGGAGAAGANGDPTSQPWGTNGGNGGKGKTSVILGPTNAKLLAGGGAGGGCPTGNQDTPGSGGPYGGGTGGQPPAGSGGAATANTGGGGGGGGGNWNEGNRPGGPGGDGYVVVRYIIAPTASQDTLKSVTLNPFRTPGGVILCLFVNKL